MALFAVTPHAVIDDVITASEDYVCDTADAIEQTLLQHPEMKGKALEIKHGVDRWQAKMMSAAEKGMDGFELDALKNVFAVPEDLQLAPPDAPAGNEDALLDAETEALWARLQQALATKRELQKKVTYAQNVKAVWESHRAGVQRLAASQQDDAAERAIQGATQLKSTLQQGWSILRGAEGGSDAAPAPSQGPRGLQQRFAQRRAQIETVGVADLGMLSSLLTAS